MSQCLRVSRMLSLIKQALRQFFSRNPEMCRDAAEDARQGSEPERIVFGNGDVVLRRIITGESQMTSRLTCYPVSNTP